MRAVTSEPLTDAMERRSSLNCCRALLDRILQPAVELVARPPVATFLKCLHCLFVEGGGHQDCAGLRAARAKLDGLNLGSGDVVGLVLAKIGKGSG